MHSTELVSTKPAKYRAPSWSWACLDGAVAFDQSSDWNNFAGFEAPEFISFSVTPAGKDPPGHVESGSISLRGRICRQMWQRKYNRKWYYAYCVEDKRPADRSHASLLLDIEDQSIQELEIWSMPLKEQFGACAATC